MSEYIVKVEGQIPDAIYERQLEEIVRCRDCKHYEYDTVAYWCCRGLSHQEFEVEPDGFCKWGER